jgi:hypothetical protein
MQGCKKLHHNFKDGLQNYCELGKHSLFWWDCKVSLSWLFALATAHCHPTVEKRQKIIYMIVQ